MLLNAKYVVVSTAACNLQNQMHLHRKIYNHKDIVVCCHTVTIILTASLKTWTCLSIALSATMS